jgi:general nucleoside transport system permease protein
MLETLLQAGMMISILVATVRIASPILLAAMGELITERSGIMNLGLEGTMLFAAFIGFLAAEKLDSLPVAILLACLAGALFNLILAFMAISLNVDQTITGLSINLLASGLTLFWFRITYLKLTSADTPLVNPLQPIKIPLLTDIPVLGQIFFSHNILTYLAFLAVPMIWFFLYRMKLGLQLRSLGEDPRAADMVGIRVTRLRYFAVVAGGLLAGLAGAFVSIGSVERFFPDMTGGRGWLAIVIVISGNWKPSRILIASLLFAFLDAFQLQVQAVGVQLPYQVLLALPYVLAIVVMIIAKAKSVAPESLGVPYMRE